MTNRFSSLALLAFVTGATSSASLAACSGSATDAPQDAGVSVDASGMLSRDGSALADAGVGTGADAHADANADSSPTGPVDAALDAPDDTGMAPDVGAPACTIAQRDQRAAAALYSPLVPLSSAGGVPLHSAPMQPQTLLGAETALCPGVDLADLFGDGSRVMGWGPNSELWLDYDVQTTKARFFVATSGYVGEMTFHSPDASHSYVVQIDHELTKDGQLFALDWQSTGFDAEMDELYRAMLATYSPTTPQPAMGTLCTTTGECTTKTFGSLGYVYFKSLGAAIWVANVLTGPPTSSVPSRIDIDLVP
jgi:hypothetical protein